MQRSQTHVILTPETRQSPAPTDRESNFELKCVSRNACAQPLCCGGRHMLSKTLISHLQPSFILTISKQVLLLIIFKAVLRSVYPAAVCCRQIPLLLNA